MDIVRSKTDLVAVRQSARSAVWPIPTDSTMSSGTLSGAGPTTDPGTSRSNRSETTSLAVVPFSAVTPFTIPGHKTSNVRYRCT